MNDEFVSQVMAQVRIAAHLNGIRFTESEFRDIALALDFKAVTALERADGEEMAWIGEGQAEARRLTYGH